MKILTFDVVLVMLFSIGAIFPQDMTVSELTNKVKELERRIVILEKNVLESNSELPGVKVESKDTDKAIWRKLSVGMNETEVKSLLGEPSHVDRFGPSFLIWEYSNEGFGGGTINRR